MTKLATLLLDLANRPSPVTLEEAVELLLIHERLRVAAGSSKPQGSEVYLRETGRLGAYARTEGATHVSDLATLAVQWIESPQLDRRQRVMEWPTAGMKAMRRSVVLRQFKQLREWGLTSEFPGSDTSAPRLPGRDPVPLSDLDIQLLAQTVGDLRGTIYPVIFALCVSGVTSGEVCDINAERVDLIRGTVHAPGSGRVRARVLTIRPEHLGFVAQRISDVQGLPTLPAGSLIYGGKGDAADKTSFAGMMLGKLYEKVQLTAQPKDLNIWAARKAYEENGQSLSAARDVLGIRSLDRVEKLLGLQP